MSKAESDLGKRMLDFERQQHKDEKRGPLPCDIVPQKQKLSGVGQMAFDILTEMGTASAQEIADRCKEPVSVKQAARALTTLFGYGMVKRVTVKPRRADGPSNLYEVVKNDG